MNCTVISSSLDNSLYLKSQQQTEKSAEFTKVNINGLSEKSSHETKEFFWSAPKQLSTKRPYKRTLKTNTIFKRLINQFKAQNLPHTIKSQNKKILVPEEKLVLLKHFLRSIFSPKNSRDVTISRMIIPI